MHLIALQGATLSGMTLMMSGFAFAATSIPDAEGWERWPLGMAAATLLGACVILYRDYRKTYEQLMKNMRDHAERREKDFHEMQRLLSMHIEAIGRCRGGGGG